MTYFCSQCQQADPQLVNVRYDGSFITLLSIAALGSAVTVRGHHCQVEWILVHFISKFTLQKKNVLAIGFDSLKLFHRPHLLWNSYYCTHT